MQKLMIVVDGEITASIPEIFAVIFDCWEGGDTHYVATFATFSYENSLGFSKAQLGMSPMENGDFLNAAEHYVYLEYVILVHGNTLRKVSRIVGDN